MTLSHLMSPLSKDETGHGKLSSPSTPHPQVMNGYLRKLFKVEYDENQSYLTTGRIRKNCLLPSLKKLF